MGTKKGKIHPVGWDGKFFVISISSFQAMLNPKFFLVIFFCPCVSTNKSALRSSVSPLGSVAVLQRLQGARDPVVLELRAVAWGHPTNTWCFIHRMVVGTPSLGKKIKLRSHVGKYNIGPMPSGKYLSYGSCTWHRSKNWRISLVQSHGED